MTDIYDGNVWKIFKETDDEEGSEKFFWNEVADSHIGLMINLDWFQPYDGTIYSIGIIYAAICNLPWDIWFKRENLLTLGLLPGPSEVSLHRINHYLALIIDELKSLWDGITLNRIYECQEEKNIQATLILVSCNMPAARKICGYVSALVSCHLCEKRQIMRIGSITSLKWIIWKNGSLPGILPNISKMLKLGDGAIWMHQGGDLWNKIGLDGLNCYVCHISILLDSSLLIQCIVYF